MMGNFIQTRLLNWWKGLYLVLGTILIFMTFSHQAYDDPFITYRYAENLRAGLGFVYNPGEFVLSTTTPLFTLLLALFGILWTDVQLLANFIGVLSIVIGGLLLWELAQTWGTQMVGWSGLLLYPTFPLLLSTLGSETPLFLALILGTFVLYARQQYNWAILLISLTILARSDGVLVAALLGVHYIWINRSQLSKPGFWREQPWFWVGIAVGVLLVWHGFAWMYFGSPLPVTLAAKQAQGRMAISQHFAPGLLRVASWYSGHWQYWIEFVLILFGTIFSIFKKPHWVLILAWAAFYFLAYSLLDVTSYFWYYAPLVPGGVVAIGLGITFFGWVPLPNWLGDSPLFDRIHLGFVGLLLATLFVAQVINIQKMSKSTDPRFAIYRAVGEWLNENTPVDSKVGGLEVGIIGYFSQRTMVDFAGLIQPTVADQMQMDTTYDDSAYWAVQTYKPKYLVLINGAHPRLERDLVAVYCHSVTNFSGAKYNFNSDLNVFACQYP